MAKSNEALTPEQRLTISRFRHQVENSSLSPEAIRDIQAGGTFNNIDRMAKHVEEGRKRYEAKIEDAGRTPTPEEVAKAREAAGRAGFPG